ncbi:MAG: glycerophosphodiester phosphodiesterase [Deltaproteobacteria bacterium]|nr:MAG: glycerophosphodiester phosphodiesterase [Deltaproteobacteria bacterium]
MRFPENTIEAFDAAVAAGIDLLELDVHGTSDGRIVVIHDDTLDRTTDGSGPVRSCSAAELQALDAGYRFEGPSGDFPYRGRGLRIPLFDEVLERFPDTPLNVEIKQLDPPIERQVIEALDRYGARERVLLAAGDHRILERIRGAAPDVLSGMSAVEVADFLVRSATGDLSDYRPAGFALQVPVQHGAVEVVTDSFVAAAHEVGLEVHVWTINDADEMKRLLALGVDGLMSDDPELLLSTVR